MNGKLLKNIHETEFDMLCKCKEICEENNIPYYLCYGTLLGAVRHKGFIPWDDDIDIMIPVEYIPEFKKFFLKEYSDPYFFSDIETENICIEPWSKIRRSDTTSMPKAFSKIDSNWGICIDIFPLYPISANPLLAKLKYIMAYMNEGLLRSGTAKYKKNSSVTSRLIGKLPYFIRKNLCVFFMHLLAVGKKDSEYVFDGFMTMKRSDITDKAETVSFEGTEFSAPAEIHKYLTDAYGDYMQLPPENERNGHADDNGEIIWDTKNSYRKYMKSI